MDCLLISPCLHLCSGGIPVSVPTCFCGDSSNCIHKHPSKFPWGRSIKTEGFKSANACLKTTFYYHRLVGEFYQILDVVVLMLFKSCKQHVHNFALIISGLLTLSFLLFVKFFLLSGIKGYDVPKIDKNCYLHCACGQRWVCNFEPLDPIASQFL